MALKFTPTSLVSKTNKLNSKVSPTLYEAYGNKADDEEEVTATVTQPKVVLPTASVKNGASNLTAKVNLSDVGKNATTDASIVSSNKTTSTPTATTTTTQSVPGSALTPKVVLSDVGKNTAADASIISDKEISTQVQATQEPKVVLPTASAKSEENPLTPYIALEDIGKDPEADLEIPTQKKASDTATTAANPNAVVDFQKTKIDEESKTNAENQGIEQSTDDTGASPNEDLTVALTNPGLLGGIDRIESNPSDKREVVVTYGNGESLSVPITDVNEAYGLSIPTPSNNDSGVRYNNTTNPYISNAPVSNSNSTPTYNDDYSYKEETSQIEEAIAPKEEPTVSKDKEEAKTLKEEAEAFNALDDDTKENYFLGFLAQYLGADYNYDPTNMNWVNDLVAADKDGTISQATMNNLISVANLIRNKSSYSAEKADKTATALNNKAEQTETINSNADALRNYATDSYNKILETNSKNHQLQVDELNASYKDSTDALDRNRNVAQQEASVMLDRLNKYLPQQIKASGLSGLGVSQSALLSAQNQYATQMGNIGANYNTNLANLSASQRQQLNTLNQSKNSADQTAYQNYSDNVIDIENGRYNNLASAQSKFATQEQNINNNYWSQVNANNNSFNDTVEALYSNYVGEGLSKKAAEAMAKAQAEQEAASKKQADAVSAKEVFNDAFNELLGVLDYEDALELVTFNYNAGFLSYGEWMNYVNYLNPFIRKYSDKTTTDNAINYYTDPRFTSN